ncbi:MAG: hypothetical protein WDW36_007613 [Sanguina aurantia]
MANELQRREALVRILAAEGMKTGAYVRPSQAIFRETFLDTHNIRPTSDFRPSTASSRGQNNHHQSSRNKSASKNGREGSYTRPARLMSASNQGNVRSVFRPSAEQLAATSGAVQRRQNMSTSEWALLDAFEVQLFDQERKQLLLEKREAAVQQRLALDRQMVVQRAKAAAKEQEKREDSEVIMQSVVAYRESERLKAEAVKAISRAIKVDQDVEVGVDARSQGRKGVVQLAKATAAREQAVRAKHEEELQLLAEGAAAMEAERKVKADKAEAARQLWQATVRGNDERIVAKRQAQLLQRQEDDELMQESIRTVEAQMVEREEKAKAFHAMIAARASRAGVQVVEESRGMEAFSGQRDIRQVVCTPGAPLRQRPPCRDESILADEGWVNQHHASHIVGVGSGVKHGVQAAARMAHEDERACDARALDQAMQIAHDFSRRGRLAGRIAEAETRAIVRANAGYGRKALLYATKAHAVLAAPGLEQHRR